MWLVGIREFGLIFELQGWVRLFGREWQGFSGVGVWECVELSLDAPLFFLFVTALTCGCGIGSALCESVQPRIELFDRVGEHGRLNATGFRLHRRNLIDAKAGTVELCDCVGSCNGLTDVFRDFGHGADDDSVAGRIGCAGREGHDGKAISRVGYHGGSPLVALGIIWCVDDVCASPLIVA